MNLDIVKFILRKILAFLSLSRRLKFYMIYILKLWSGDSASGPGSSKANTSRITDFLITFIEENEITSICDIPCGDFYWFGNVLKNHHDVKYIGFDIVKSMIQKNNRKFGSKTVKFDVLDLVRYSPPKCDLLICRDLMVHLSEAEVQMCLANIRGSGAKFVGLNSYDVLENYDCKTGEYRALNLDILPYHLNWEKIVEIREDEYDAVGKKFRIYRLD